MPVASTRNMRKPIVLTSATIVAVTVSVAAFYRTSGGGDAPTYNTATVTRGDLVETVEATGTLDAVTTVPVGSQVSGTIASLHADFNSVVKTGQVIARLDPSLMQAQVDQAEATIVRLEADVERARVSLDDARLKLDRARALFAEGLIPRADLETAETTERSADASVKAAQAQVTQARAALNQNRVNLGHTVITAPVDGIVISRNVDVGQTVAASMSAPTLFVIAKDLTRMQVEASIDEADIGRIQPGQAVTFRVDAYPRESFTGSVVQVRLEPQVVQNVVSYVTVIDVPNPNGKLKPGMTANVEIEIARADDVLIVPNAATRFQPEAPAGETPGRRDRRVWTLHDGELQPVRIETGITNGMATVIVGGQLQEGMPVVTGVVAANQPAENASTASPLLPRRPGGNRQGGAGRGGQR